MTGKNIDSSPRKKSSQKHVEKATEYIDLFTNHRQQIEAMRMIFSPDELHTILDITLKSKK
jgi:hypothetical protein